MKIFWKQKNSETTPPENATAGVLTLLERTEAIVRKERVLFSGYAAWAIFPALATFGIFFLPVTPGIKSFLVDTVFLGDLILSVWISACITLQGIAMQEQHEYTQEEFHARIRKAFPTLFCVVAFCIFCSIAGFYLAIIPGIIALVWLAFSEILVLKKPETSFSQAIVQSREVSRGRFFSIFSRLFLGNFVFGCGFFLLALIALGSIFAFMHIDADALLTQTLAGNPLPPWIPLLLVALSLPFTPYTSIYLVVLYDSLKKS